MRLGNLLRAQLPAPLASHMDSLPIILWLFISYFAYRFLRWRLRIAKLRRTMTVIPIVFDSWSILRRLWPKGWQKYHYDWTFHNRGQYGTFQSDIVALIPLFGFNVIYIADADAIAEIAANPVIYPKDLQFYGEPELAKAKDSDILDIYGKNIVTTEGAEWKPHRKITVKSFSEKDNKLVHEESISQASQMMASWESKCKNGSVVIEKHASFV